jgi:hypothetical protein
MRRRALHTLTLVLGWLALTAQVPPAPPPIGAPPGAAAPGRPAAGAPPAAPPGAPPGAAAPGRPAAGTPPAAAAPAQPPKPFTYYRWIDAQGVIHYTQLPPPEGIKETPKTREFVPPVRAEDEPEPAKKPEPPGRRAPATKDKARPQQRG